MENKKSDLELFREKRDRAYTFAEIKEAFDNNFSVYFDVDKEKITVSRWRYKLFSEIWKINPDAIIKEAYLCVLTGNPAVNCKQILVVTGFVTEAFCFFSERKNGVKKCYRNVFGSKKPVFVNKGNLLTDGEELIITVRTDVRSTK